MVLSSNEFDELRRENRNCPILLVIVLCFFYVITFLARLAILSRQENMFFTSNEYV
jgi:hypothetical protein